MDEAFLIVALPEFTKKAKRIFSAEEYENLLGYLKDNPTKGDVMPGTGGIRKIRAGARGKGKRGGARVIYYYQISATTIYLLTVYEKHTQIDLAPRDKKQLKLVIEALLRQGRE